MCELTYQSRVGMREGALKRKELKKKVCQTEGEYRAAALDKKQKVMGLF